MIQRYIFRKNALKIWTVYRNDYSCKPSIVVLCNSFLWNLFFRINRMDLWFDCRINVRLVRFFNINTFNKSLFKIDYKKIQEIEIFDKIGIYFMDL